MKAKSVNELRTLFLDFFAARGHVVLKSASLVPENDDSLLLIGSGMAPLKLFFTGHAVPPGNRCVSCQKCIRTVDIDIIGKTTRHGTFFEMLGNFSFGDYFKSESLAFTWEFLTKAVGLSPDRLYPSVYVDDEEAVLIWTNELGIAPERIFRFGKEDNFWEHGAGPCGPCSEVYYDRGEKYGCGEATCNVGCDCDRYVEVWNNVFTQYDGDGKGNYTELESKNIDTGMGLERLAMVVQDVESLFEIDSVLAVRKKVSSLAAKTYGDDKAVDISTRIVTDHIRAVTFMIADGIMPTNEGRGYVLRRIIRRASRHGRLLGIPGLFLVDLCKVVIGESNDAYPELMAKQEFILNTLSQEEQSFHRTIDQGLLILADMEAQMMANDEKILAGKEAFKLYDTFGFPIDLTEEILAEKGYTVDVEGFDIHMQEQKDRARKARKTTNYLGADASVYQQLDPALISEFAGFDAMICQAQIIALVSDSEIVSTLTAGESGTVLVDWTPFYPAGGGQCGDSGVIRAHYDNKKARSGNLSEHDSDINYDDEIEDYFGEFTVSDTLRLPGGHIAHIGRVTEGKISVGDVVMLTVDSSYRVDTCKNHSATHLLHKTLRMVLGMHVEQAGSFVDSKRLRFDFSHFEAMLPEEIIEVEQLVNQLIKQDWVVEARQMSREAADEVGAMALFGEKYGDVVRVVMIGDSRGSVSAELCGGAHVTSTGPINVFKIISESGIAAGVRRIEALTGDNVLAYYEDTERICREVAARLKTEPALLSQRVETLLAEIKKLQAENESLRSRAAKEAMGSSTATEIKIGSLSFYAAHVPEVGMNDLRELGDVTKARLSEAVILLISDLDGKVNMMAMADEAAVSKGANAGELIKAIAPLVGGGGGGKPGLAQAGGKNPAGIEAALAEAESVLKLQLIVKE
jgi:alanyl-tRNA synthetase